MVKKMSEKIKSPAIMKKGIIYLGKNHAEIIKKHKVGHNSIQGFITNGDIFVDRKLALKIAMKADQLNLETVRGEILMTEDLKEAVDE